MGDPAVFCFSIDVLTDGSEYTGDVATLFLSLWKKHKTGNGLIFGDDTSSLLLARYAVAGCSCDVLSRAAADQRYKLGGVKAVFATRNTMVELTALPGLLYASQQAVLTVVVSGAADALEQLVETIHGNQRHPVVRICQVPASRTGEWWKVYDDENVVVHASRYLGMSDDTESARESSEDDANGNGAHLHIDSSVVVYLYTFRSLLRSSQKNSLLILPEASSPGTIRSTMEQQLPLPIVASNEGVDIPATLLTTIVIQPDKGATIPENLKDENCFVLLTRQQHRNTIDMGLLVRAQQQTCAWRQHCSPSLLKYFPYRTSVKQSTVSTATANDGSTEAQSRQRILLLRSGASFVFCASAGTNGTTTSTDCVVSVACIDRNEQRERNKTELAELLGTSAIANGKEVVDTCNAVERQSNGVVEHSKERNLWPEKLNDFLTFNFNNKALEAVMPCEDENEIDLDGDDDDQIDGPAGINHETSHTSENPTKQLPHLLVLGTGCASPSPYRGASGYALILPSKPKSKRASNNTCDKVQLSSLVVAIEVGEGYCTQWNRYAGDLPFSSIQLIWISHAHWDHYGGLVNLLVQIYRDKQRREQLNQNGELELDSDIERPNKRCRAASLLGNGTGTTNRRSSPPWVVAPVKVLKFLKLMFNEPTKYFREVLPDDSVMMAKAFSSLDTNVHNPILFWENVRVDHSCQAYGFVLGLRDGDAPYIFCFSGDTRPSWRLVQVCREFSTRNGGGGRVDFLLHEATFESEKHMSLAKKHSTVQEALGVGRDVDARRLLLTHFSQRYDSVPAIGAESDRFDHRMLVGFALDGMLFPLFVT